MKSTFIYLILFTIKKVIFDKNLTQYLQTNFSVILSQWFALHLPLEMICHLPQAEAAKPLFEICQTAPLKK